MSNDLSQQLLMTSMNKNDEYQEDGKRDENVSNCKDRCKNCCQYFKIIILALIICGCVSGIWSFLTHVESITPIPDGKINGIHYHNGIACLPATASFYAVDQSYCNDISSSMATNSTSDIEWQCAINTDYSDSNIVDTFSGLKRVFYIFVIFVCLASYFTCIHDIALLRKAKNGTYEEIRFWPSNKFNNFPSQHAFYEYIKSVLNSWDWDIESSIIKILCCPFNILLFIICIILSFIIMGALGWIDAFYMLFIYPFIHCKCNGSYCCSGMVEVSSIWIGLSRTVAVIMANILLIIGMSGIANPITSTHSDECKCSCEYLLHEGDVLAISAAVIILTASNLIFIWSWYQEAHHKQWHFYLIKYSLPIRFVHAVQPTDPTGSIIDVNIGQKIKLNVSGNDENDLKVYDHRQEDKDIVSESCRFAALFGTIFEILIFLGIGLGAGLPTIEKRGYSQSIMIICSVVGWTVFSIIVLCTGWLYCKHASQLKAMSGTRTVSSVFVFVFSMGLPTWIELFSKK